MKSVLETTTWLTTPGSIKCILVDITGVGNAPVSNFYLSNLAYYDSTAAAMYNACVNGNLNFSESLSIDGSPSISNGTIEITNAGGANDAYLQYVWSKRAIKIYLGDPSWVKSDFVLIFDGLVQDLTTPNENILSFTLFDKLQRLNDTISETTLVSSAPTTRNVTTASITSNVAQLTFVTDGTTPFAVGSSITVTGIPNFNGTFTVTASGGPYVRYALTAVNQTGTITAGVSKVASGRVYSQNTLGTMLPLTFGECFNIQPLLVDNGANSAGGGQVYMYHNGPAQGIIEVRDNGVPVTVTELNSTGTFELLTDPFGIITASVQGATTYTNTVAGIITKLVTEYGSTSENRFLASEIDFTGFTNVTPVGIYCPERRNIIDACAELAKSLNANLICPAITISSGNVDISKLKLIEIKAPAGTPLYYLNDDNMVLNTLSITEMFPVKPSIKLGYCKNWSIQSAVASGLNPTSTSTFGEEYWYTTAVNTTAKTLYRDSGNVAEEPTVILQTATATTEATKRLTLWETQRYLITATYLPQLIFVQLGDIVQIKSARFNLSAGKTGMVYSLNKNWVTGLVEIGVLV